MEEKPNWWRMAEIWPRLPVRMQEALIDMAEVIADELAKVEGPESAIDTLQDE